uniref:Uncharacterized protein n=1 Tax=Haptolina ericina TaxID=156174 RepID=A0A7S3EVB6_9EUKA|mmetsp:Transcript_27841/g.62942  ORF Transcript_27841/g.62942 Transcript_27841/m.62942 type:complete len:159 (+) Transcript_27841:3-479(+)
MYAYAKKLSVRDIRKELHRLGVRATGLLERSEYEDALVNAHLKDGVHHLLLPEPSDPPANAQYFVRVPPTLRPGDAFDAFALPANAGEASGGMHLRIQVPEGAGGGAVLRVPSSIVLHAERQRDELARQAHRAGTAPPPPKIKMKRRTSPQDLDSSSD